MLSQTLTRAVKRLSRPQLFELLDLAQSLLAELDEPPDPPERKDREVLEQLKFSSVTYQLERVHCGKKCGGCPHGPYWYAYYRSGGRVVSKYIGKDFHYL